MLLEADLIEKTQLENALHSYKKTGKKLGQFLVREGIVSEEAIVRVIADQLKIKRYNPNQYTIKQSLASILDVDTADRKSVV